MYYNLAFLIISLITKGFGYIDNSISFIHTVTQHSNLKWMSMTLIKGDITDENTLSHGKSINVKTIL